MSDKPMPPVDANNVLREVFNQEDDSITVSTFVSAQVGNKVVLSDTESGDLGGATAGDDISYQEGDTVLYVLRALYSDAGKTTLISVERVS
jgi:hypothetical protein